IAFLAVAGGVPGTIIGALASAALGGTRLLVLSGVMLLVVGVRVLMPDPVGHLAQCAARRDRTTLVLAASFGVGLLTGLLANGGGFLLVPLFILVFGLTTGEAAGTSMVAVGALTIPTLIAHWTLGHIDWSVALTFAVGVVPGSLVGARLAGRIPTQTARRVFGFMLVGFALWFLAYQLV
ncbi:MAG: sulfite exporter TauE/SafE family protein, partial [Acidimicrobiia bacterium]